MHARTKHIKLQKSFHARCKREKLKLHTFPLQRSMQTSLGNLWVDLDLERRDQINVFNRHKFHATIGI